MPQRANEIELGAPQDETANRCWGESGRGESVCCKKENDSRLRKMNAVGQKADRGVEPGPPQRRHRPPEAAF